MRCACTVCSMDELSYEGVADIVDYLKGKTTVIPKVGIICGSGLGGLGDSLDEEPVKIVVPYNDIPGFPKTTVKGHKGNLIFGYLSGCPVMCMQGRFHFYEGHAPWKITMPVRVMKLMGVKTLVVTNAAGGLNAEYKMGDIMLMKDHLNFCGLIGFNPLMGPNDDRFGERFLAMTQPYDPKLRRLVTEVAKDLKMDSFLQEGVYSHVSGPSYETPTEARFMRMIGCDAVGMSTAPEVVVAKHCGMNVLGLSLITNMVILDVDSTSDPPCHAEVMETADKRSRDMQLLVKTVVGRYFKEKTT